MITTESAVGLVGFYVNGAWEKPQGRKGLAITNPATGAVLAEAPFATADDVDRAVRSAHEAFRKWRDVPVVERVQVLYRFKALLEKHGAEVAAILTRENGKTADDSKMEVRRGIQMAEVACGMPSLMMGNALNDVAREIDCKTIRQPIGVCVGITPFNFPAMVPLWMYPFAIACGNTFVLKPSEKVPLTPTRVIELLAESGLPPGVLEPDPRRQGDRRRPAPMPYDRSHPPARARRAPRAGARETTPRCSSSRRRSSTSPARAAPAPWPPTWTPAFRPTSATTRATPWSCSPPTTATRRRSRRCWREAPTPTAPTTAARPPSRASSSRANGP